MTLLQSNHSVLKKALFATLNLYYCQLRGLVGTDGSIHVHKSQKKIRISFKNASQPLVNDFKDLCEVFAIKTGKIYPVKGKNTFQVAMETKYDVGKFIDNIQPRK